MKVYNQKAKVFLLTHLIFFILLGVVPIFSTFSNLFSKDSMNFIFFNARGWSLLGNTILLGMTVSLLSAFLGIPLGFLLSRTDLPLKRLLRGIYILPLFLPPYILAIAYFDFFEGIGILNRIYTGFLGSSYIMILSFFPITILMVEVGLSNIGKSLEEAGWIHRGQKKTHLQIILPLTMPFILAASLLTFILTIGEFGVPAFLGFRVYTVEIYTQFSAFFDIPKAMISCIPIALLALIILFGEKYYLGKRAFAALGQKGAQSPLITLGRLRNPIFFICIAIALLSSGLPLLTLFLESFNMATYKEALELAKGPILNSLITSMIGAAALTFLGFLLAYYARKTSLRGRRLCEVLPILFFSVPGAVIGMGFLGFWNRPYWLFSSIYTSPATFIMAFLIHYSALPQRLLSASLAQIPQSQEEFALLGGIPWWKTIQRIHFPLLRKSLISAFLVAFIFCLRDLETVVTIYPPGWETLTVRIFTIMANSPSDLVAALCLLQVFMTLIPLILIFWTNRRIEDLRDKNVPPIDRPGFLTPPKRIFG